MPLTFKEAREQLYGADFVVKPGSVEFGKIKALMKEENEKHPPPPPPKPPVRSWAEAEKEANAINVPPPPKPVEKQMTRDEMFRQPSFKQHFITYLDRIGVGKTRVRQNTTKVSTTKVETNATSANERGS